MNRHKVLIENGEPGAQLVRFRRAKALVKANKALWTIQDKRIRLLVIGPKLSALIASKVEYDRHSGSGLIERHHMRHTPLTGGREGFRRLITIPSKRGSGRRASA